ncbi:MAG: tetratricopeptide repeat protein, partial [Actinobacteria bacterium]|nr:tetratricopeptide repeat protein [Actinomycetota bacterium]
MIPTEFRVLGPLEVERDGTTITIAAPKERALLAYLLLNADSAVAVDRIVDALWGSAPPSSAVKLVQLYVSHLRSKLGRAAIETVPSGYRAQIAPGSLDRVRFEQLLREGREARASGNARLAVAILSRALALWRGPALVDVSHADFAVAEAGRLEDLRLDCAEERLAARLALGEHEDVLAESAKLSAEHPHRERLRGLSMVALYRAGRQVEALEVFRKTREELLDELGLEPGDDLRAVERAILRQDPTLVPTVALSEGGAPELPAAVTALIGRERALRELRELVLRTDVRLVSLVGAGGSGKTRLALALAAESGQFFGNGVAVADLSALRESSLVLPAIAHAVRIGEQPGESLAETLAAWAKGRELLLVVDNFEQLTEAGPALLRFIEASPLLTVVVTSRRVLHLSGEHVFPVEPLAEDAAARLFVERARALDPKSTVSADDPDVREICRSLDGLPLAIELAAARTRTLTPGQLHDRLGERLTLLASGPHDLPARQQTLRDTLDWSVALMSDTERALLARLSVFPSDVSLDAVLAVTGSDVNTLAGLVDGSMLQRDSAGRRHRFRMLETVREYALELLGPDRKRAADAHAVYFLELAEGADLRGSEQGPWLDVLDEERDNLQAALDHAHSTGNAELELRFVVALWRFWWLRGHLAEGRFRLETAIVRADEVEPRLRADAYRGGAGIAWSQGDLARARELASLGLEVAEASGDGDIVLACHTVLGLIARDEGDYERARRHLERSCAIASDLGREGDELVAKMNLGSVAFEAGEHEVAVPLWIEVLEHHHARGNSEGEGIALLNLGLAAYRLGHTKDAQKRFAEAEALFDAIGFREHLAHALQGKAATEAADHRYREAAQLLGRAAALLEETGSGAVTFDADLPLEVEAVVRGQLGDREFAS